ncbi:MAG: hypothetical protein CL844_09215 [Crocinitomicaceae bacterium]|nr:hypothetical protein [Crocinitomicaceae bacterium]
MSKSIHIVTLDVPLPINYGGAIDMFYRIKALKKIGFKITLHCFEYGRGKQDELKKYAEKVIYYKRKKNVFHLFSTTPFIIKSRSSQKLLSNLCCDDSPVLFEGIHTTSFIDNHNLKNRIKIVRCHNIEHDYYKALSKRESGIKSLFYYFEAKKLLKYNSKLSNASALLAIQNKDLEYFKKINVNTILLPASMPVFKTNNKDYLKNYILFHGNLSVSENDEAARWLIENVCSKMDRINFKFAGSKPTKKLKLLCDKNRIELIESPNQKEMNVLISEASIHILYTNQNTGVKLKLLYVLLSNGIVIANPSMVDGTDLKKYCCLAKKPEDYIRLIKEHLKKPYDKKEIIARQKELLKEYDTPKNCQIITDLCNY